jgi:hypothetical protein
MKFFQLSCFSTQKSFTESSNFEQNKSYVDPLIQNIESNRNYIISRRKEQKDQYYMDNELQYLNFWSNLLKKKDLNDKNLIKDIKKLAKSLYKRDLVHQIVIDKIFDSWSPEGKEYMALKTM